MAVLASAQLTSAITANQTVFGVQSIVTPAGSVGFPAVGVYANPQQALLIDGELMYIVLQNPAGTLQVRTRGAEGTLAVAHDALANCYTGTNSDFGSNPTASSTFLDAANDNVFSIGSATYTLALPSQNTVYNINATSAAAITLPAPLLSQNGLKLTFTSNTAFAHVITGTGLIQDGSANPPHNTITLTAQKGAGVTIVAENGLWNIPTPSTTATIA